MAPEPVPYRPDIDDKINFLWEFWSDPCDAPLTIYARAAWPALLHVIVTYYALDVVQIFTGWAKPRRALRQLRSQRHKNNRPRVGGRRTWLTRWKRWSGFDPWDELGRRFSGPIDTPGRPINHRLETLWNLYDLEQQLMYRLFVFELATDGFYKWAAGVANSEYCKQQYQSIAVGRRAAQGGQGIIEFWPVTFNDVVKERNGADINGDGGSAAYPWQTAVFTGTLHIAAIDDGPFKASIRTGAGDIVYSETISYPGGSFAIQLITREADHCNCAISGPGFWTIEDAEFTVWSFPPDVPLG